MTPQRAHDSAHDPAHDPAPTGDAQARRGRDGPPPAPPRELPRDAPPRREFEHGGQRWHAWLSGKGVCGTGSYGLGLVEAVHFSAADEPDRPLREALLARGRFDTLFDDELGRLFDAATPITNAPDQP